MEELNKQEAAVVAACEQHMEEIGVDRRFNRGEFIRMGLMSGGLLLTGGLLAACGEGGAKPSTTGAKAAATAKSTGKLNGYTTAYFSKADFYADYKAKHGYVPKWTAFARAEEQIPKIQQHPGLFDVCMTSINRAKVWVESGVLQEWDLSAIPNYERIYKTFRDIDRERMEGNAYEVAFFWGRDSIAYNTDHVDDAAGQKIASLFDPKYKGKIGMQNSAAESFAVAGLHLGVKDPFRMTDDEYQAAKDLLIKQKPLVRSYWTEPGELGQLFSSGEVVISWAWPPVVSLSKGVPVTFVRAPEEGGIAWDGGMGLCKGAKNVHEAHVLADWLLTPPAIKWMADNTNNASTSELAADVLTPEQLESFGLKGSPDALLSKLHFQDYVYEMDKVAKLWQEVQTA